MDQKFQQSQSGRGGEKRQNRARDVESENRGREGKWMDGVRKERQGQPRW